jgi:hypothetical protein
MIAPILAEILTARNEKISIVDLSLVAPRPLCR